MSRDQYVMLCGAFVGTTIRELRHIRDWPRASMRLARGSVPPPTRRHTDRLPLHEIEEASRALART
ncbi:MAG TPA: hypothetical protein VIV11_14665 [Kofleriaceae bacterium]